MSTSEDVYPRFTLDTEVGGPRRIAYRVSESKRREILDEAASRGTTYWVTQHTRPPRFRVKIDPFPSKMPIILFDASRPAYRGRFYTLAGAMLAIDNVVRQERGEKIRIGVGVHPHDRMAVGSLRRDLVEETNR